MKQNGGLELTHPMIECTFQHDRFSGTWKSITLITLFSSHFLIMSGHWIIFVFVILSVS